MQRGSTTDFMFIQQWKSLHSKHSISWKGYFVWPGGIVSFPLWSTKLNQNLHGGGTVAGQIWSKPRFCCNQSRLSKIRLCLDGKGDINLKINPWEVTGRLRSVPIPPVELARKGKWTWRYTRWSCIRAPRDAWWHSTWVTTTNSQTGGDAGAVSPQRLWLHPRWRQRPKLKDLQKLHELDENVRTYPWQWCMTGVKIYVGTCQIPRKSKDTSTNEDLFAQSNQVIVSLLCVCLMILDLKDAFCLCPRVKQCKYII